MTANRVGAAVAITSARLHFYQDCGCNQDNAGAGSAQTTKPCTDCHNMPRWWVNEPYEDLWIADIPLYYTMSSGQEWDFELFYKQRFTLPESDENGFGRPNPYSAARSQDFAVITNGAWGNNWNVAITLWDTNWENAWVVHAPNYNYLYPPATTIYSSGYEALYFQPAGGVNYFSSSSSRDPASQMVLQPVSSIPIVTNNPTADANGIYWGDQGIGLEITYPDGSQDVFGLTRYAYLDTQSQSVDFNLPPFVTTATGSGGTSTAFAYLTQKIDPQGRVIRLGYELATSTNHIGDLIGGFRVRYVVDPDGRTNTFLYATNAANAFDAPALNPWMLTEVDDPYGRKARLGYEMVLSQTNALDAINYGILTNITDAAGLSNSIQYQAQSFTYTNYVDNGGVVTPTNIAGLWHNIGSITNLTTPYGSTSFTYYQSVDTNATQPDCYLQNAVYVQEPTGAQQLFYYQYNVATEPSNAPAPSVSGQTFDDGWSGTNSPGLNLRNTYHWGRRQFPNLSSNVQIDILSSLSNALANLAPSDFVKAGQKHWLLSSSDFLSLTEGLSSERDPSPDAAGNILGMRTWYNYLGKAPGEPESFGVEPQISCVARTLPDGTSQYSTYNFYPAYGFSGSTEGMVSSNVFSYTAANGSVATLTNWFAYAPNWIDLASVSNSAGQRVSYSYNGNHEVTTISNSLGQVTGLNWDSTYGTWNLTQALLPDGATISFGYYFGNSSATLTNLLESVDYWPSGRTFEINSYQAGNPASVTDDRGVTVTNAWDGLNRLTGTTFPDGTTISNIYSRLDVIGTKDRLGNWTYSAYDGLDHLLAATNANGAVTEYSWCGCGSLESIQDALNNTTSFSYDNQGNLTNVLFPDLSSLTYRFDLARRLTNAMDGAGRFLQFGYNNQGLVTGITNAGGRVRTTLYDAVNRPVVVTDADGVSITNQYDLINELTARVWPDGIGEGFGYGTNGLLWYTNRDQKVTRYGRDAAERMLAVTNANQEVTQFSYDSMDHVTGMSDGLAHTTGWQYNEYGWLTNKTDGLGRNAFQYAYNANGWVTNRWTPEKGNTGYTYDNVGNLTNIAYPGLSLHYAYDALNRLTNMVDAVGTNSFAYTAAGQLLRETGPWTSVTNNYVQGLRTAMGLGTSWLQTYAYDALWRTTNVTSPAGSFSYAYNFQPASALVTGIQLPNAASITNGYDALARLQNTALNNYWGHTLDGYTYGMDALGLRTNILRNLGLTSSSVSVGYDNIGQITSWLARETNGVPRLNEQLGFGFDAADNLHTRTNGNLAQMFTVDAANQLNSVGRTGTFTLNGATPSPVTNLTVNGLTAQTYGDFTFARTNLTLANGANTFTNVSQNVYGVAVTNTFTVNLPASVSLSFDNNGNLTNDGTRTFGYDWENQLTNVMAAGEWRSDFVYDGLNRRRIARDYSWSGSTWVLTNEVHYIYDRYLLTQERDTNGNILVTYTRGLDLSRSISGAGGIGGLLARTDTSGSTFYHADGAGNITALMDGSENVVARYMYGPFGKLTGQWGPMASVNEMQFSSMPQRRGIALLPLRPYLPELGRFANADPIQEAGGINLYRFVGNSPLNSVDPWGLAGTEDELEAERAEFLKTPEEQWQEAKNENQVFGEQEPVPPWEQLPQPGENEQPPTAADVERFLEMHDQEPANEVKSEEKDDEKEKEAERKNADGNPATKKLCPKTYQTYTKTHPQKPSYAGRTSGTGSPDKNVAERDRNHHMSDEGYGPAQLDKSSSDPNAIRGREQQLIEANGGAQSAGGTSGNAINGVSPANPNASTYNNAANAEFGPVQPKGP